MVIKIIIVAFFAGLYYFWFRKLDETKRTELAGKVVGIGFLIGIGLLCILFIVGAISQNTQ